MLAEIVGDLESRNEEIDADILFKWLTEVRQKKFMAISLFSKKVLFNGSPA